MSKFENQTHAKTRVLAGVNGRARVPRRRFSNTPGSGPAATARRNMSPFADLDDFLALPRVSGLAVSPDGSRLVTTVSELNEKRTEYVTAVWELDVAGERPARRLTRGAKGESSAVFSADGDLLFVATRDVPGSEVGDEPTASLWRVPGGGGGGAA